MMQWPGYQQKPQNNDILVFCLLHHTFFSVVQGASERESRSVDRVILCLWCL
jgi:hypothetical protein